MDPNLGLVENTDSLETYGFCSNFQFLCHSQSTVADPDLKQIQKFWPNPNPKKSD
jgi:hypothetical protein